MYVNLVLLQPEMTQLGAAATATVTTCKHVKFTAVRFGFVVRFTKVSKSSKAVVLMCPVVPTAVRGEDIADGIGAAGMPVGSTTGMPVGVVLSACWFVNCEAQGVGAARGLRTEDHPGMPARSASSGFALSGGAARRQAQVASGKWGVFMPDARPPLAFGND
jgi:hypothetical protein